MLTSPSCVQCAFLVVVEISISLGCCAKTGIENNASNNASADCLLFLEKKRGARCPNFIWTERVRFISSWLIYHTIVCVAQRGKSTLFFPWALLQTLDGTQTTNSSIWRGCLKLGAKVKKWFWIIKAIFHQTNRGWVINCISTSYTNTVWQKKFLAHNFYLRVWQDRKQMRAKRSWL